MNAIKWDERLSLGVKELDDEHRFLIGLANLLIEASASKLGRKALAAPIAKLRDYTVVHFQHEEAFMERIEYPNRIYHRQAHATLKNQVKEYQRLLYQQSEVSPQEVKRFIRHWLIDHILGMDLPMGRYAKEHPLGEGALAGADHTW